MVKTHSEFQQKKTTRSARQSRHRPIFDERGLPRAQGETREREREQRRILFDLDRAKESQKLDGNGEKRSETIADSIL